MKTNTKFQPEHLNQNLVARNNVSYTAQLQLCELYDKLEALIEVGNASLSIEVNREIADKIEQLEFNLQRLWGFPESKMHHKYWSQLSMCLCNANSMDNLDDRGYRRIIRMDCLIHNTHINPR